MFCETPLPLKNHNRRILLQQSLVFKELISTFLNYIANVVNFASRRAIEAKRKKKKKVPYTINN